jgi:hypothetical protein
MSKREPLEYAVKSALEWARIDYCKYNKPITSLCGERMYRPDIYCPTLTIDEWEPGAFIECRWQAVSGSADEKAHGLIEKINNYPLPTLIVCDGSQSAWARKVFCKNVGGKLRQCFTLVEFIEYLWSTCNGDTLTPKMEFVSAQMRFL